MALLAGHDVFAELRKLTASLRDFEEWLGWAREAAQQDPDGTSLFQTAQQQRVDATAISLEVTGDAVSAAIDCVIGALRDEVLRTDPKSFAHQNRSGA